MPGSFCVIYADSPVVSSPILFNAMHACTHVHVVLYMHAIFKFLAGFDNSNMLAMALRRVLCSKNCVVNQSMPLGDCDGYKRLRDALHVHFKYTDFRPGQLEALLPVVHGRDVFVHMPTGGGKSLCMFLPPLAISECAIGIVVSPLISLMDQQVSTCCKFI